MSLEATIEQDLKQALLAKDERVVSVLRMLKSSFLYAKVAAGTREAGLADNEALAILSKEAKKRQESADLFKQGGNNDKAEDELAEKAIIERYLPKQLGEAELSALIEKAVVELDAQDMSKMGQVIGFVKQEAGAAADGALVARLAKERLSA